MYCIEINNNMLPLPMTWLTRNNVEVLIFTNTNGEVHIHRLVEKFRELSNDDSFLCLIGFTNRSEDGATDDVTALLTVTDGILLNPLLPIIYRWSPSRSKPTDAEVVTHMVNVYRKVIPRPFCPILTADQVALLPDDIAGNVEVILNKPVLNDNDVIEDRLDEDPLKSFGWLCNDHVVMGTHVTRGYYIYPPVTF